MHRIVPPQHTVAWTGTVEGRWCETAGLNSRFVLRSLGFRITDYFLIRYQGFRPNFLISERAGSLAACQGGCGVLVGQPQAALSAFCACFVARVE